MIKYQRNIFLYLSIISLCIAIFLGYIFLRYSTGKLYYSKILQHLVDQTKIIDRNVFEIKEAIQENNNLFDQSFFYAKYPTYVYCDQELIYWSEYIYEFSYSDIAGFFVEKCIEKNSSIFFIKKSSLKFNYQDYEIVSAIPLKSRFNVKNEFLQTSLNSSIFPDNLVNIVLKKNRFYDIYSPLGVYLFSIDFAKNHFYHPDKQAVIIFFMLVCLLFFSLFLYKYLSIFLHSNKAFYFFIIIIISVIGIRALMIYFRIPYQLIELELFSAKLFASSLIFPSLGDFFLNTLALSIIILFLFFHYTAVLSRYKNLIQSRSFIKKVFIILFIFLSYVLLYGIDFFFKNIYLNSKIEINITKEIDLTHIKLFVYLIFVLISVCYFLIAHICIKFFPNSKQLLFILLLGNLFTFTISQLYEIYDPIFLLLNTLYLYSVSFFKTVNYLLQNSYRSLLYMFFCAFICAWGAAYTGYKFEQIKIKREKEKFISDLLIENDLYGEFFLSEMLKRIFHDQSVHNVFLSSSKEDINPSLINAISEQISKSYIDKYFDKYHLNILFFDASGNPYNFGNIENYKDLYQYFPMADQQIRYIRFFNDVLKGIKKYHVLIPLYIKETILGYIVLELKLKKIVPFRERQYKNINSYRDYSYMIFKQGKILYSQGEYNYDKDLIGKFPDGENEIISSGFLHTKKSIPGNQILIISSKIYPFIDVFSNFSSLFLTLIIVTVSIFSIYSFMLRSKYEQLNLSTKIQLYLNMIFFISLFAVSIVIVSILNSANKLDIKQHYMKRALDVASKISNEFSLYYNYDITKEDLENILMTISEYISSDINLYSNNGTLLITSQRYFFDNHFFTRLLDPFVYRDLILHSHHKKTLNQQIGSLNYSTAYVGIKSFDSGKIIGVLSIPFFEYKYTYDKKVIDVFTTILNIFTCAFLILLILLHFSARSFTKPLLLVTQKIKKISLSNYNEPLDYPAKDEIGLLVEEYNKMLVKLEESKAALARNEKQAAWKEIAQQVAHEIKNPLTPMKLSLQQLQRTTVKSKQKEANTIKMLLQQIEILDDIATSFSSFAKMPLPAEEIFEINDVLHRAIALYTSDWQVTIQKDISEGKFFILGDKQLMGRIFNNLIINALQSVRENEICYIYIGLKPILNDKIFIEFRDKGSGISEKIQSKVFIPNFTTKKNGTGIGLSIAKRGIENCGGNIWFETKPNKGTSFFIELPLYRI